jgi:hypothetical protein
MDNRSSRNCLFLVSYYWSSFVILRRQFWVTTSYQRQNLLWTLYQFPRCPSWICYQIKSMKSMPALWKYCQNVRFWRNSRYMAIQSRKESPNIGKWFWAGVHLTSLERTLVCSEESRRCNALGRLAMLMKLIVKNWSRCVPNKVRKIREGDAEPPIDIWTDPRHRCRQ